MTCRDKAAADRTRNTAYKYDRCPAPARELKLPRARREAAPAEKPREAAPRSCPVSSSAASCCPWRRSRRGDAGC